MIILNTFFNLSVDTFINNHKLIGLTLLKGDPLIIYFKLNILKSRLEILLHVYGHGFKFVLKDVNFHFILFIPQN